MVRSRLPAGQHLPLPLLSTPFLKYGNVSVCVSRAPGSRGEVPSPTLAIFTRSLPVPLAESPPFSGTLLFLSTNKPGVSPRLADSPRIAQGSRLSAQQPQGGPMRK
jgi:hypothetical protein